MARIIDRHGNVEELSDGEFFARIFGHAPRTKAERLAEHRAAIERYVAMIEAGDDWAVPPPYLAECRRVLEGKQAKKEAA